MKSYDLMVIGGGSGGIAISKRAVSYGKKVVLFESKRLGGTCVNVGCVPKKVMFNTAEIAGVLKTAKDYGYTFSKPEFNYSILKKKRDDLITRLNGIYARSLDKLDVHVVKSYASFVTDKVVECGGVKYTAPIVVIAGGGIPNSLNIPGIEHTVNSDKFFNEVKTLPKKVALIGAGYIAVEMAGVLNKLGSDTTLIFRKNLVLRGFDEMLRKFLTNRMKADGIHMEKNSIPKSISKDENGIISIELTTGKTLSGFDLVILAVGRYPVSLDPSLKIRNTSVKLDDKGFVKTNKFEETSVKGTYAIGDIIGKILLTPVAIATGRRLADRIFNKQPERVMEYENVPSVIFSHPPIGTIGLTEAEAREKFGDRNIKVYNSTFSNLWWTMTNERPKTNYKIVCQGRKEKIVGLHIIGMASDEILQGFGVAVKMGATKKDFDNCVAIHPTAGEELVTMV